MPTQADVRRIALKLPDTTELVGRFGFTVMNKGKPRQFVWSWKERIDPKKPRVASKDVIAVRVANLATRELILASNKKKFFTEPHYNGYPAVLVRLKPVTMKELRVLIEDAWRCMAPKQRD